MKDKINRAIDLQYELNCIKRELRPKFVKVAQKRHPKLGESITNVVFYSDSISFTGGGYAMGYFEEDFEVTIEELEKMS